MKTIIRILNRIEEWTLALVLLALAFITAVQVFCRYVLGFSFTWMEDLSRCSSVFISFLGAALGVKYGAHFSMNLVFERVSNDRFRHGLKIAVNVIGGLMFFVIAWYGWQQAMKLRQFGVTVSTLQIPKYWAYLPIPFFSSIMGFRFLNLALKHLAAFVRREPFTMIQG